MANKAKSESLDQEKKSLTKLGRELQAIRGMHLPELQKRYLELFGIPTKSNNLPFLRKKLAWRVQELMEGGLFPDTQAHINALAPIDIPYKRLKPLGGRSPKVKPSPLIPVRDPRLPQVGTTLHKEYRGRLYEVEVHAHGFSHRGTIFHSLSALAKEITGTAWNGFLFFGLMPRKHVDAP